MAEIGKTGDMFRVKICGVTNVEDAVAAAAAGADAVGLNFYARSRRYLDPRRAEAVAAALPVGVVRVGLFVNAVPDFIRMLAAKLRLQAIQLHGDETVAQLAELADLPLIKAFPCHQHAHAVITDYMAECRRQGVSLRMILLDAAVAGQYGGTGQTADWGTAAALAADRSLPPVVLAGGLSATNVRQAIELVRPAAVDTAGGVELAPGVKDRAAMEAFVAAAAAAMNST